MRAVHAWTPKRRKERRVDVHDAPRELLDKLRRQNPQESCEAHQLDLRSAQQLDQPRIVGGAVAKLLGGQHDSRHARSSAKAFAELETTSTTPPAISPRAQASRIAWRFVPFPDTRTPMRKPITSRRAMRACVSVIVARPLAPL